MSQIDVPVSLFVDDKTRHWTYFMKERSPEEMQSSLHKTDTGGASVHVKQPIYNGRDHNLCLDEASFELISAPTTLSTSDFYAINEDTALKEKYYAEVSALVQKKLGCDRVICMHHQVRNAAKAGTQGVASYAGGAPHTDSSSVSGDELALNLLKSSNETTEYKRYLYVNLWRNISDDPIENDHLAVLDERTTAKPDDYIPCDLISSGYSVVQYHLNARHAKHHKWYYFPRLLKNEGILFKQTDSDFTLSGRTCFHMSVKDPNASSEAKPRESIELRMFCYWKEATVDSMPSVKNMRLELMQNPESLAQNAIANTSLQHASFGQLFLALISKVFSRGGSSTPAISSAGKGSYSGNPADYINTFVSVFEQFSYWPSAGKAWATGVMTTEGEEKGLLTITQTVVDDSTGQLGTRSFAGDDKRAIVDALLADSRYVAAARKALSPQE